MFSFLYRSWGQLPPMRMPTVHYYTSLSVSILLSCFNWVLKKWGLKTVYYKPIAVSAVCLRMCEKKWKWQVWPSSNSPLAQLHGMIPPWPFISTSFTPPSPSMSFYSTLQARGPWVPAFCLYWAIDWEQSCSSPANWKPIGALGQSCKSEPTWH